MKALATCLDGQRIPVAAALREPGPYPYWGANGIQDWVDEFLFNEQLVLLGEDGAPFLESTKNVAFAVSGPVWVNNHAHVLRPRELIDGLFLAYALNAVDYAEYITGSTRDKLTQHDMNRIALPVPPLNEQRAIADYLDRETARIDALVTHKRRMIELLGERRTVLLLDAVAPAGFDWDIEKGTDLSTRWQPTRLKYMFAAAQSGVWGEDETGTSSDTLCVRVADFDRRRFKVDERAATMRSIDVASKLKCRLSPGDVLIEKSGGGEGQPVGFAVVFDLPVTAVCSNFVARLRPKAGVVPRFAGLFLAAAYRNGRNIPFVKQTTGIQNLDLPAYLALSCAVPDQEEQSAIVSRLERQFERLDRGVKALEDQIALLNERRQALITAVVTGQLQIPEAA